MASDTLTEAISLIKAGKKTEAHQILESLIAANPHNVPAWIWDAGTSPTTEGRIQVMELCLQQNPGNNQVIEALTGLKTQLAKDALLAPQPQVAQLAPPPAPPPASTKSDFITMQCPSCGGKLAVGGNALSLKCEHCGTEHMIRHEAGGIVLESYARCPICGRNDRAEKISAIVSSQTHTTQDATYENQTSQASELAKRLTPPPRPDPDADASPYGTPREVAITAVVLLVVGGIFLSMGGFVVFGDIFALGSILAAQVGEIVGAIALIPIALSVFYFIHAIRETKASQERRAAAPARLQKWNAAMKRWNRLYYCGRDDCVFVPSTNTHTPAAQMNEYLYQS